ncbi:MAG TPA: hypothetical protein VGZ47_00960 [Gemmataceae bacterium]|nr:hypothetical protein [Gemmataceae bacterium]
MIENIFQVSAKLRENGNPAKPAVLVDAVLLLADKEPIALPVHVTPTQRHMLGGASQAAVASQGDNEPPYGIRAGVQHRGSHVAGHKEVTSSVYFRRGLHARERVFIQSLCLDCIAEKLLGSFDVSAYSGSRVAGGAKMSKPRVGIRRGNGTEFPVNTEKLNKARLGVIHIPAGPGCNVLAAGDVAVEEFFQAIATIGIARLDQSHRCQLRV